MEPVHLMSHCKIPDDYENVYSLTKRMRNLCIIFPDQLNPDFSSLLDYDKELDEILMCEFKKDFKNLNHHFYSLWSREYTNKFTLRQKMLLALLSGLTAEWYINGTLNALFQKATNPQSLATTGSRREI